MEPLQQRLGFGPSSQEIQRHSLPIPASHGRLFLAGTSLEPLKSLIQDPDGIFLESMGPQFLSGVERDIAGGIAALRRQTYAFFEELLKLLRLAAGGLTLGFSNSP